MLEPGAVGGRTSDVASVQTCAVRDDGGAALDRSRLARHLAAGRAHLVARLLHVRYADRDVAEGAAKLVLVDAVVIGELEHRGAAFIVVADEGERILLLGAVGGAQE